MPIIYFLVFSYPRLDCCFDIEILLIVVDACAEVLEVIQNFIPILENGCTTKILNSISPLYILAELDMRLRVCDLLDALAASDTSILLVVNFALVTLSDRTLYIVYFSNNLLF